MIALVASLLLSAEPAPDRCQRDGDCIISTFAGCCGGGCCGPGPYAVTRATDRAAQAHCAVVDCAAPAPCDSNLKCEAPALASAFRAVCRAQRCEMVPAPQPSPPPKAQPQCTADSDCTVVERPHGDCGVCGCCPGMSPEAVTLAEARRRSTPDAPVGKPGKPQPPPYGLTPGKPLDPPLAAPNCSPCQRPPVVRARCTLNRCVLDRQTALDE